MKRLLVIGGSDAGTSAAIRAREVDPQILVTVLVADRFPNYSICGLPFLLSGEVADHRLLAHRTTNELEELGLDLRLGHRAVRVDCEARRVLAVTDEGRERFFDYDRLIIATGASSFRPSMRGLDLPGVFFLRCMGDAFALRDYLAEHEPDSSLIIGSGYIGVEMADALTRRGLSVTMMARGTVLKTVDGTMSRLVREELARNRVTVAESAAAAIERGKAGLVVNALDGRSLSAGTVLVATGSEPNSHLAANLGIDLGAGGAIRVNRAMETGIPDIYAAGDCVETWHRLLGRSVYLPLGTTAHKQGLVAGENAVGGSASFAGSVGTQVVKIFDIVVARTGLLEREAILGGFAPRTVEVESFDHKAYYPGAGRMWVRMTADERTGAILGGQILGRYTAEVSKRADVLAAAVSEGMTVRELADLDLSYTPPTSSPWDPIQSCAHKWLER